MPKTKEAARKGPGVLCGCGHKAQEHTNGGIGECVDCYSPEKGSTSCAAFVKKAAAPRIPNPWGKMRPKENPYAIYRAAGWEWRVLKAYQSPGKELNNGFARWYCFVTSPMLPDGEYGDVYVNEIVGRAVKVEPTTAVATCLSYAPEVIADDSGKWAGNALRFATREEAKAWVEDLRCRWFLVREVRVVESNEPVNSKYPKE